MPALYERLVSVDLSTAGRPACCCCCYIVLSMFPVLCCFRLDIAYPPLSFSDHHFWLHMYTCSAGCSTTVHRTGRTLLLFVDKKAARNKAKLCLIFVGDNVLHCMWCFLSTHECTYCRKRLRRLDWCLHSTTASIAAPAASSGG